jgi:hypothetical protein
VIRKYETKNMRIFAGHEYLHNGKCATGAQDLNNEGKTIQDT